MNTNWSRWIVASIAKHFNAIAVSNNVDFHVETDAENIHDSDKYFELRINGPIFKEPQHNTFIIEVSISVLWGIHLNYVDIHETERLKGVLVAAMEDICAYKYGDGDAFLGTLSLIDEVHCANFGKIPNTNLVQGTVDATFKMFLTT